MDKRELTCICCPLGCSLEAELEADGRVRIKGQGCKRGESYGIKECTNPTRIVTTTVSVKGGTEKILPVKTERDIPKDLIFDCIKTLKDVEVQAPVKIGDIVTENILNTGVNIVAAKNINSL